MTLDSAPPSGSDRQVSPATAFDSPLPPERVRQIPGLADTFVFFVLAIITLLAGELLTVNIGQRLTPFRHESFVTLAGDARLMIPSQALQYAALLTLAALLFRTLWRRPFWRGVHWNAAVVAKRWPILIGIGLMLGAGTSVAGNYLPMPREAPILNSLMHSTAGAWLMLVFGTTGAPLLEELAFRGFLLPSLVNFFRSPARNDSPSADRANPPFALLSILLTSLPFALLHALQVSYAWAPVLLIGIVSIALCIVRLWANSLAASTLVHAIYNFSLFAGMLYASDGFRHLEKLNN